MNSKLSLGSPVKKHPNNLVELKRLFPLPFQAGNAGLLSPWAQGCNHCPSSTCPSGQRKSPCAAGKFCTFMLPPGAHWNAILQARLPTRLKFTSLSAVLKISTAAWMGKVRRDNFFPPVLSADFCYCHIPWTCFTISTEKAKQKIIAWARQESIWKYDNTNTEKTKALKVSS